MLKRSIAVLALAALASCGPGAPSGTRDSTAIRLESSAFADGQAIPARYGCDSQGLSPPLSWSNLPGGTRSIAIAIDDPDASGAPGGKFRHWAAYDIPAAMSGLPEGAGNAGTEGFKQSLNDARSPGYIPMCPPKGDPPHHYHFRLFALDVPALDVADGAKVKDVEERAAAHKLAETELIGTFERK
jgi:Raf kinase inhibitor-like YbhB/YbcL family protein